MQFELYSKAKQYIQRTTWLVSSLLSLSRVSACRAASIFKLHANAQGKRTKTKRNKNDTQLICRQTGFLPVPK